MRARRIISFALAAVMCAIGLCAAKAAEVPAEAAQDGPQPAIVGAAFEPETVFQSSQADFTLNVAYTALTPGRAYYITATLLEPETGLPFLVQGLPITETIGLVPDGTDGVASLAFSQDVSTVTGTVKLLPSVEIMQEGGFMACTAADGMPELSLVSPTITQTFLSVDGSGRISANAVTPVVQTVTYHGLEPNAAYTVRGTLCRSRVDMPIEETEGAGAQYVASQTFVPTSSDGQVVLTYKVNGNGLAGATIVPAWELYKNNSLVAVLSDGALEPKVAVDAEATATPAPTEEAEEDASPTPEAEETEEAEESTDPDEDGEEPEETETPEEEQPSDDGGGGAVIVVILIAVLGVAGAAAYFLFIRKR